MRTFLKVIFAIVLMMLPFVDTVAQTVSPFFVDGSVYVKISGNATLNVANDNGKINPRDVYFLDGLVDKYQIVDMKMPFISAKSDIMQRTFQINFSDKNATNAFIKELKNNPSIEYVEMVPLYFTASATPDDLYYNNTVKGTYNNVNLGETNTSWHLDLIKAQEAWGLKTGDENIIVAVLDNSIWTDHPDLVNVIDVEKDFADNDDDVNPPSVMTTGTTEFIWSHGTHTAGLIAGETTNSIGIASIGNGIKLMAIKLSTDDSDGRTIINGTDAIIWAADNGANVINVPWYTTEWSQTMLNAVNYAYNKGCVIVAAAGNSGSTNVNYPAAFNNVIAVASCDAANNKSLFSNYGSWIDVLAPGGYSTQGNSQGVGKFSILSTTYNDAGTINNIIDEVTGGAASYANTTTDDAIAGKYDIMYGTSVATAITSGLCGLILSANPNLTPEKVKEILKSSCDNVDDQNQDYIGLIGAGRINAFNAITAAISYESVFVADFEADAVFINLGETVNFTDLSIGNPTGWSWKFEGGFPKTSADQNPSVEYRTRGIFSVELTTSLGETNTNTEVKRAFIIVGNQVENPSSLGVTKWIEQETKFPTSTTLGVQKIEIVSPEVAWVLGYDINTGENTFDFSRTANGGIEWQAGQIQGLGVDFKPVDITATSYDEAWLLAANINGGGSVFKTIDGGTTWEAQTSVMFDNAASVVKSIKMLSSTVGFCIGDVVNGKLEIYNTLDGGTNWSLVTGTNLPAAFATEKISTITSRISGNVNNAWFGTNRGRMYKTTDGGKKWTISKISNDTTVVVKSLTFGTVNKALAYYYQGDDENIYSLVKTANGGSSWTKVEINFGPIVDVAITPGRDEEYVAIVKDLSITNECKSMHSFNGGTSWIVVDTAVNYTNVAIFNDSCGWAGGYTTPTSGGIYKWPEAPKIIMDVEDITEGEDCDLLITVEDKNNKDVVITSRISYSWMNFIDNGNDTAYVTGTSIPIGLLEKSEYLFKIIATNGVRTTQNDGLVIVHTSKAAPTFVDLASIPVSAYVDNVYSATIVATDPDAGEVLRIKELRLPQEFGESFSWLGLSDHKDGTATLSGVPSRIGSSVVEFEVFDGLFRVSHSYILTVYDSQGVDDLGNGKVSVYPNPTTNFVNISNCEGTKYEIIDIMGKVISAGYIENSIERIDMTDFSNGNLFIKIYNNDKVYTTRIVKM